MMILLIMMILMIMMILLMANHDEGTKPSKSTLKYIRFTLQVC